MENLVPLEGTQAAQTSFPFGSQVYVFGGEERAFQFIETHGIVTGVYIKMVPILEMLFKVKTPVSEEIYKSERLRFRHGCPVYVSAQDSSAADKGVVLGICDVPRSSLNTADTYWYSVEVESKEMGGPSSAVRHEVSPCDVKFRQLQTEKSEEGKSKDFPIAICIKEEPNYVISCVRDNYTKSMVEKQPEIQLKSKIASAWGRAQSSTEIDQKKLNASKSLSMKRRPVDKPSLPASDFGPAKEVSEQIPSVERKPDQFEPTVPAKSKELGANPVQSAREVVGMPSMLCLPLSASRHKKRPEDQALSSSKTQSDRDMKSINTEVHLDYKRQRRCDIPRPHIPPRPHASWTKVNKQGTRIYWCDQCTKWATQYHVHKKTDNPTYYCWTHGVTRNAYHTSVNCNKRGNGHTEKATFHHRLGGSNKNS